MSKQAVRKLMMKIGIGLSPFFLAAIIVTLALTDCQKNKTIEFDPETKGALTPWVQWAVIIEPYAAFRSDCGFENEVTDEGRLGEILEVVGKSSVKNSASSPTGYTVWYKTSKGWIDENLVYIYDNKLKAQSASDNLLK